MASRDDDFSLLSDDQTTTHHHHHLYAPHRFASKPTLIHAPPHQQIPEDLGDGRAGVGGGGEEVVETEDDETNSAFHSVNPFDESSSHGHGIVDVRSNEKRKDPDEIGDYGNNNNNIKKSKSATSEYRKDREEWSDAAIGCLLEAYLEKFTQLNRGNLRGRDWEEVAAIVSERCEKQTKSVEQCKNKVDNLKKRYKLERHRMTNGGISASHWPWYKKMEEIVGNSLPVKSPVDDDKGFGTPVASSGNSTRQSKRFSTSTSSPVGQITTVKSKAVSNPKWRRVVFKISGVTLAGTGPNNIDPKVAMQIAREVAIACRLGIQVAIVVGSRNFFCGETWVSSTGSDRCTAYQVGMMASVMNSILLQSALEKMDIQTRVQTAFAMPEVAEPYSRQRAIRHLEKGRVVIFGGIGAGTGNPIFSTDTAAALRALEIHAEAVLKGTNVDGVYDCHSRDNNATFEHITFRELASRGAAAMDLTALNFCEDNGIPVVVFNLLQLGNISKALCGEQVGTLIDQTGRIC